MADEKKTDLTQEDLDRIDDSLADGGKSDDDLWDELESAENAAKGLASSPSEQDAEDNDDQDAPLDADDEDGSDDAPVETAQDDGGDAPVDESAKDDSGKPAPAEKGKPNPWDSAPEELRNEFDKLSKNYQAQVGRVRSLETKLRDAATTMSRADAGKPQGANAPKDLREAMSAIDEIRDDYPEIYEPIRNTLESMARKISDLDEFRSNSESRSQVDAALASDREAAKLAESEPDYADLIGKNWSAFEQWRDNDAPVRLAKAANRNLESIQNADEALEVVQAFKEYIGAASAPPVQQTEQPQSKPLNSRRERQLAGSASPGRVGRTAPARSGIPKDGDPDELWDYWDKVDPPKETQRQRY